MDIIRTVGVPLVGVSILEKLRNFLFPDFRNRFTCVAAPGNGEVDTLRCFIRLWEYQTFIVIVTPFKTGLFQA